MSFFHKTHLAYLHDIIMAALSIALALYLRVGSDIVYKHLTPLFYGVPLFTLIAAITFRLSGLYKGIWRYASLPDLIAIIKAVTISIAIFVPVLFLATRLQAFPRSVPVIHWFLLASMLGGPRILYRLWKDGKFSIEALSPIVSRKKISVLLVGVNDGSELFIRTVSSLKESEYKIVGILDTKGGRAGRELLGVKVYSYDPDRFRDLLKTIEKKTKSRPQKIIFTHSNVNLDKDLVQEIDVLAEKEGLTMARLPDMTHFKEASATGEVPVQSFALEDLLGRSQVPIDKDVIQTFVKDKKILITGAGGSVGSELVRQICSFNPAEILLLDQGEYNLYQIDREVSEIAPFLTKQSVLCDVREKERINRIFNDFKPALVFHAAALKHVPMVELNPEEGILTNLIGTMNVADACQEVQAEVMIQISTDKAVNPTSVMGVSKRLGELYAQSMDLNHTKKSDTRFITVRFGNVLGSSGSVIPLFQHQLAKGGPLTVTHPDIKRFFMTVREAVGLVLQASAQAHYRDTERGEVFVLDMDEPVKIADIARKVIRLAGLRPEEDIKIIYTGLRPGEKLYEELFDQSETPLKTNIDGVMGAKPQPIDLEVLRQSFAAIEKAAREGRTEEIYRLLRVVVKGYKQNKTDQTPLFSYENEGAKQ